MNPQDLGSAPRSRALLQFVRDPYLVERARRRGESSSALDEAAALSECRRGGRAQAQKRSSLSVSSGLARIP
jgi:hypothetical protein